MRRKLGQVRHAAAQPRNIAANSQDSAGQLRFSCVGIHPSPHRALCAAACSWQHVFAVIEIEQVSSTAPLRGSGVVRHTVQLISGYQLNLQIPVADYDSNMTVNGNAGINIAGQVRRVRCRDFALISQSASCCPLCHLDSTRLLRWERAYTMERSWA
jgi:hypothetical protein